MRTDRGWRRFYMAGWLISAGVMAVTFRMWQLHVRQVEERAEVPERTKDRAARPPRVQEALTNGSSHAGAASAAVDLHYGPGTLSGRVDDDGKGRVTSTGAGNGTRPSGPGLGLVGMRERISALGGQLQAGPRDAGGFRVRAELPARAPS